MTDKTTKKRYKVLTVGPDIEGRGGISSVLQVYRRHVPDFTFLPTNSRCGHVHGYLNLLTTMLLMPFRRMAGFNVVHAHGGSGKSFIRKRIVLRWASVLGFKTIFHCHGGGFADYSRSVGLEKMRFMLADYDSIVCLSEKWRKYFAGELGFTKSVVVENIVEAPDGDVGPRTLAEDENLRLLFLGKLCREKGIFELVEAVGLLARKNIPVNLTIGGVGPEEDSVRLAVRKAGISGIVRFAGWVEGKNKEDMMRSHHIMVLPSYIEGVPISLLEAGAYGMPSVATPVGAVADIVTDRVSGTIVPVGDSVALATALENYAMHPSLIAEHGLNAISAVRCHFPEQVCMQLDGLYKSLFK